MDEISCTFCGEPRSKVELLIAATRPGYAGVFICDGCISLCCDIVEERKVRRKMANDSVVIDQSP